MHWQYLGCTGWVDFDDHQVACINSARAAGKADTNVYVGSLRYRLVFADSRLYLFYCDKLKNLKADRRVPVRSVSQPQIPKLGRRNRHPVHTLGLCGPPWVFCRHP